MGRGKKTDNIDIVSYNSYRLTFLIKIHQAITNSMFTFPACCLALPICMYRSIFRVCVVL